MSLASLISELISMLMLKIIDKVMLMLMMQEGDCVHPFLSILNSSLPVSVHERAKRYRVDQRFVPIFFR